MTAEQEYRKEPWNREKSDAYIVELENKIEELLPIAEYLKTVLLSGETYDFFNEYDWKEGCRIEELLNKYLDK